MTLIEKIIAAHAGRDKVIPGEIVNVKLDLIMAHDGTAPIAIKGFRSLGIDRVFDPHKIVILLEHKVPASNITTAENSKLTREFAREQGVIFFEVGKAGICHAVLPEQGLVMPGDLVIGADSHTCTYGALGAFSTGMGSTDITSAFALGETWMKVPTSIKCIYQGKTREWVGGKDLMLYTIGDIGIDGATYSSIEFAGEAIDDLSMDGRFTMANMAIEAGAKAGIFRVDSKTLDYLKARAKRPYTVYEPDEDAEYARVLTYDASQIEPQVAFPHSPDNVKPVSQAGEIKIDQALIGSCTNGRLEDLRIAARVFKDRQVHPDVRCIVIPATQQVYLAALGEGLIEEFIRAGAAVSTPTCGPCAGVHMGILASDERCISTTNRNFVGRMGALTSEVYLANPAVAAASAVLGRIGSPDEVIK
ncbi:3-isopropylmalate dehydratase large subunit [Chloroflexota bacterium]